MTTAPRSLRKVDVTVRPRHTQATQALWRLLVFGLLFATVQTAYARNMAVVLDTSSSMDDNDPARYALQLTKILHDLLGNDDALSAIVMPPGESCWDSADPSLIAARKPSANFHGDVDRISYTGGTWFYTSLLTAAKALETGPEGDRALLVIADAEGVGGCLGKVAPILRRLDRKGTLVASVGLGAGGSRFRFAYDSPNYTRHAARNSRELVLVAADVFQRFFGVENLSKGPVRGNIVVRVPPYTKRAQLVVAADAPQVALLSVAGNPRAAAFDGEHASGVTRGVDGALRGYRIASITQPGEGTWRFRTNLSSSVSAGYMLITETSLEARALQAVQTDADGLTLYRVELIDTNTGARVAQSNAPKGLDLALTVGDEVLRLIDTGTEGDRQANDGVFSVLGGTAGGEGARDASLRLSGGNLDKQQQLRVEVTQGAFQMLSNAPETAAKGIAVPLRAELMGRPGVAGFDPPASLVVETPEGQVLLQRSEAVIQGAAVYEGEWMPAQAGRADVRFVAPLGVVSGDQSHRVKVLEPDWAINALVPAEGQRDVPVTLSAQLDPVAGAGAKSPPSPLRLQAVAPGGQVVELSPVAPGADGVVRFEGIWTPTEIGDASITVRAVGELSVLPAQARMRVVAPRWLLEPQSSPLALIDETTRLEVRIVAPTAALQQSLAPPGLLVAQGTGVSVQLTDDGKGGDRTAGDGIYSAQWTPARSASQTLEYYARGGSGADVARQTVEVLGRFDIQNLPNIVFADVGQDVPRVDGQLDLSAATIRGTVAARLQVTGALAGSNLTISIADGSVVLGEAPIDIPLSAASALRWDLALSPGECPPAVARDAASALRLEVPTLDGVQVFEIPVSARVVPDPWYWCWRRTLLATGTGVLSAFLIGGFLLPLRLDRTCAVALAQDEEELEDIKPFPISRFSGTGIGWYRNARACLHGFRFNGVPRGAFAVIAAEKGGTRVRSGKGMPLYREDTDGEWERVDERGKRYRGGDTYRCGEVGPYFRLFVRGRG